MNFPTEDATVLEQCRHHSRDQGSGFAASMTNQGFRKYPVSRSLPGYARHIAARFFGNGCVLRWLLILLLGACGLQISAEAAKAVERSNLLSETVPLTPKVAENVLHVVFAETVIGNNVRSVVNHARTLPAAERLQYLCEYVLPGERHRRFRVTGEFVAPGAGVSINSEGLVDIAFDEQLLSPVYELLDVAAETGELVSLRERLVAVQAADDGLQQRCRAALLILIDLKLGDAEVLSKSVASFVEVMKDHLPTSVFEQWPETLIAFRGTHQCSGNLDIRKLVDALYARQVDKTSTEIHRWHTQIGALYAKSLEGTKAWPKPKNWIGAVRSLPWLDSHAALPRWMKNEKNEFRHISGYRDDFQIYRYPLIGDFEVVGEVRAGGNMQFLIAAQGIGFANKQQRRTGTFQKGFGFTDVESIPPERGFWTRFRIQFVGTTVRLWLNGMLFQETALPADRDPWFAFAGWWSQDIQFRNVQFSASASVPDSVRMSTEAAFGSWMPYHGSQWQFDPETEEIRSVSEMESVGAIRERLLRYQRPLLDGDSIEYEFYCSNDCTALHPALGRVAFQICPDGVRTHFVTTGAYERTELSPGNAFFEARYQQSAAPIPLRKDGWNRTRLSVRDGFVTIILNDVVVFKRPQPGDAPLPFGLFTQASSESARVRNIVMRGDWPGTVPAATEQELADPIVAELDRCLLKFPAVVTHDFATEGVPREFVLTKSVGGKVAAGADGAVMTQAGFAKKWSGAKLSLPFSLKGDFDIEVRFSDAELVCDKTAALLLDLYFTDSNVSTARLGRRRLNNKKDMLQALVSRSNAERKRTFSTLRDSMCDVLCGRLRLVRRGKQVHFLFAENDSDIFCLIDSDTLTDAPTAPSKIGLAVTCDSVGHTSVVWKSIRVSADELFYQGKTRWLGRQTFSERVTLSIPRDRHDLFGNSLGE